MKYIDEIINVTDRDRFRWLAGSDAKRYILRRVYGNEYLRDLAGCPKPRQSDVVVFIVLIRASDTCRNSFPTNGCVKNACSASNG